MEGILVALVLLACPVGMGAMMWFMGKNNKKDDTPAAPSSVEDLRAEQQRIAAEIDQVESQPPAEGRLAAR